MRPVPLQRQRSGASTSRFLLWRISSNLDGVHWPTFAHTIRKRPEQGEVTSWRLPVEVSKAKQDERVPQWTSTGSVTRRWTFLRAKEDGQGNESVERRVRVVLVLSFRKGLRDPFPNAAGMAIKTGPSVNMSSHPMAAPVGNSYSIA